MSTPLRVRQRFVRRLTERTVRIMERELEVVEVNSEDGILVGSDVFGDARELATINDAWWHDKTRMREIREEWKIR